MAHDADNAFKTGGEMRIFGSNEIIEKVVNQDLCPYFKFYKGKTDNIFACTILKGRRFTYCSKVEVDLDALSQSLFGALRQVLGAARMQTQPTDEENCNIRVFRHVPWHI